MTTYERVKEIREAATKSAQNHPWVEYVTFLLAELDAARAREADFHMQYRMKCDVESKALLVRAEQAEAREATLRAAARNYMAQFGQALDANEIPYERYQQEADAALRAALAEGEER